MLSSNLAQLQKSFAAEVWICCVCPVRRAHGILMANWHSFWDVISFFALADQ
uniref:Uncharacterized protein n=1 Tax=Arundo donax TaxID=35708 RepID=A0A0A8ZHI3_ARUDO